MRDYFQCPCEMLSLVFCWGLHMPMATLWLRDMGCRIPRWPILICMKFRWRTRERWCWWWWSFSNCSVYYFSCRVNWALLFVFLECVCICVKRWVLRCRWLNEAALLARSFLLSSSSLWCFHCKCCRSLQWTVCDISEDSTEQFKDFLFENFSFQ